MAYDPYGQLPSDQSQVGLKDLAGESLNPINWYLWRYQYDPRVWSIRKGVWMPFGANRTGFSPHLGFVGRTKFFRDTYKGFRVAEGRGRISSVARAARDVYGGDWFLGEKFFKSTGKQIAGHRALRKGLRRSISESLVADNLTRSQRSRLSKQVGMSLEELLDDAGSLSKLTQDQIEKRLADIGESRFIKSLGISSDDFSNMMKRGGINVDKLSAVTKASGAERFLGKLSTTNFKRFARLGARGGITLAKGAAGAMAITGLWDITKMIGEPLGRYLVENTNRLVQAYQDRYMPEMGGRIALSYMSGGAATERQRAIQAISRSYINGRSAIGNEAQYMHEF